MIFRQESWQLVRRTSTKFKRFSLHGSVRNRQLISSNSFTKAQMFRAKFMPHSHMVRCDALLLYNLINSTKTKRLTMRKHLQLSRKFNLQFANIAIRSSFHIICWGWLLKWIVVLEMIQLYSLLFRFTCLTQPIWMAKFRCSDRGFWLKFSLDEAKRASHP